MGRMAQIAAVRMIRALLRLGWVRARQKGSHVALTKDGRTLIVPEHRVLKEVLRAAPAHQLLACQPCCDGGHHRALARSVVERATVDCGTQHKPDPAALQTQTVHGGRGTTGRW